MIKRSRSLPATSTTSSGLTVLLTVWPGATQSTKLLPSSKRTKEAHPKTRDRGGRPAPPPPPYQTLLFPADTARGPVSPASVWSATNVPPVDDNVDKLHKSSFAKPSHEMWVCPNLLHLVKKMRAQQASRVDQRPLRSYLEHCLKAARDMLHL